MARRRRIILQNTRSRRRTFIAESNESDGINIGSPGFIDDDFETCSEAFLRYVRSNNRSKDTIAYYRKSLRIFEKALADQGMSTRLQRITEDVISEGFIRYSLDVKQVKYVSVATSLRAVRAFLNWAVSKSIITVSPMRGIKIGAAKTKDIETFTREQLRDIFRQPDLETFVGFRDYTMLTVFLETGIRLREITDILVKDVRFADSQILVHGKNGDVRLVPFQAKTGRIIKRYLKARGKADVDYLFITHDDAQMSRKAVQDRVSKYGRMAGIDNVRCSPHTFRHTFAKMSVKNGADIFALQKILGHQTLEMVRVYVNLFSSEVTEAHRKFSPVENLF